jgi:hypothetical protein
MMVGENQETFLGLSWVFVTSVLAHLRFQGQRLPFYSFKAPLNLVSQSEGLTETCSLQKNQIKSQRNFTH